MALFADKSYPEISIAIKHLNKLDRANFRRILQVVIGSVEGKMLPDNALKHIRCAKMKEEDVCETFAGLYVLCQTILKHPVGQDHQAVEEELKGMNIPSELVEDIVSVIFGSKRESLDTTLRSASTSLDCGLKNFRWRIDVIISNNNVSRVLVPVILMELTLTNGKLHTVQVPMRKFHELRFSVATALKEVEELEKRSVLKA